MMDIQNDREALERLRRIVQEAENKGDLAMMEAILADDLTVIAPGNPVIRTKEGGVAFLKSWFDAFKIQISYQPEQTQIEPHLAYQWATYDQITINKETGEKAFENGRILWVYKKYDGRWLQHLIIWNTLP